MAEVNRRHLQVDRRLERGIPLGGDGVPGAGADRLVGRVVVAGDVVPGRATVTRVLSTHRGRGHEVWTHLNVFPRGNLMEDIRAGRGDLEGVGPLPVGLRHLHQASAVVQLDLGTRHPLGRALVQHLAGDRREALGLNLLIGDRDGSRQVGMTERINHGGRAECPSCFQQFYLRHSEGLPLGGGSAHRHGHGPNILGSSSSCTRGELVPGGSSRILQVCCKGSRGHRANLTLTAIRGINRA